MRSFVYVITNVVDGKSYIGKSNNPAVRFSQHVRSSRFGRSLLSRAILKHGVQSFTF